MSQLNTVEQIVPLAPTVTASERLTEMDCRKKSLEIEKLEQEIMAVKDGQVWRRKSVRDVKLSEWITSVGACGRSASRFPTTSSTC